MGDQEVESLQYDGLGRLVARWQGQSLQSQYLWDGSQLVGSMATCNPVYKDCDSSWSAWWGQGIDNLVSVERDGDEYLAIEDARGSIGAWFASASGHITHEQQYTPEGRARLRRLDDDGMPINECDERDLAHVCNAKKLGARPMPFSFHGSYRLPESGLYYFRNRWYSSSLGQWLSQDPLGTIDSHNVYAFNRFDPVNVRDPWGLSGEGFHVPSGGVPPYVPGSGMPPYAPTTPAVKPWVWVEPLSQPTPSAPVPAPAPRPGVAPVPRAATRAMYGYLFAQSSCASWEQPDPHFFDPSPVLPSPPVPYPPGGAEGGTGHTEPDVAASPSRPEPNPFGQKGNPDHRWTIKEKLKKVKKKYPWAREGELGDVPEAEYIPDIFIEERPGSNPDIAIEIGREQADEAPVTRERKKQSIYDIINDDRIKDGRPGLEWEWVPVERAPDGFWKRIADEIQKVTKKKRRIYDRKPGTGPSRGKKRL